jgi:hypothetical protein
VSVSELFAELGVVVGEFFEARKRHWIRFLSPGEGSGPGVVNGSDVLDEVGLGVDRGSSDAGGAGETGDGDLLNPHTDPRSSRRPRTAG